MSLSSRIGKLEQQISGRNDPMSIIQNMTDAELHEAYYRMVFEPLTWEPSEEFKRLAAEDFFREEMISRNFASNHREAYNTLVGICGRIKAHYLAAGRKDLLDDIKEGYWRISSDDRRKRMKLILQSYQQEVSK